MVEDNEAHAGQPVGAYLVALKRGWFIILLSTLLVPAAAYAISARQAPAYQATAEDVIGMSLSSQAPAKDAQYYVATQAAIASSLTVATEALGIAKVPGVTADSLLKHSSVAADPNSSIVQFTVTFRTPRGAVALANAYAKAFADYSTRRAAAAIDAQIAQDNKQINDLGTRIAGIGESINSARAAGRSTAVDQAQLSLAQNQLSALATQVADLQQQKSSTAGQIAVSSPASRAPQTLPHTKRNTAVGVVVGLVLGIGAALLRDAFDTRVRSAEEAGELLGLPLLGRLPAPPRRVRKRGALALLAGDLFEHSEAYRKLRVSFDFANLDPRAGIVMVTSAVSGEGKSTTAANLAVALADVGRKVILVDLDLRQPKLHRLFEIEDRPSVGDVILGNASISEALVPIALPGRHEGPNGNGHFVEGNGGMLSVLPGGGVPAEPSVLLGSMALANLLSRLHTRSDLVLIDTPPLLPLSDAMAISTATDGYLIVSRLDIVRRRTLRELRRELATSPARGLGFVITDAPLEPAFGPGGRYRYGEPGRAGEAGGQPSAAAPR